MERIFLLCLTCCCLFFLLPTVVHGENASSSNSKKDGESSSNLFGIWKDTTKSLELVVQETVNFTKQTGTDLTEPLESKPVNSIIDNTGNLLNKTVENSVPAVDKTIGTVTDTLTKTTSEVTNTVNSVINELPTVPGVTPVVNEVSKTVEKTTSSLQDLVEKTEKIANEDNNDILKDVNVENGGMINSEDNNINPSNEERIIIGEDNFNSDPTEQLPLIPSPPVMATDELLKEDETSNLEEMDETEIVMNDGDNLFADSNSEEFSIDSHPVIQEFSEIKQVTNFNDDRKKKKTAHNPSYPAQPNKKHNTLPSAIITVTSPSSASPALSIGGQSDSFSMVIVDAFILLMSKDRQWIHNDENARIQWTHAPPGKPPQQSPF